MAYGKWNDSSDQNKLFLVSLGPDPIIRLSVRSDNSWSRDSPDGRRKRKKKTIGDSTCVSGNAVLNFKFRNLWSVCVCMCVRWRARRLKVMSKAMGLAGGEVAITSELWT